MAGQKRIEQWEVERYWEIFVSLLPPGTDTTNSNQKHYLSGAQAASVLKNSRLRDDQLERVWDLADVDNDGSLDFEEFCVAMRLVFDLVNGEYADVPRNLPDWLVPEGKAHLVQASRAVTGGERFERPQDDDDDDGMGGRLKDGFDWYMPPAQKGQYEEIYNSSRDGHGYISFESLFDLYTSLDVPETDVRSAWNLINPSADEVIGKDACLAFLHILNARHEGYRLPRSVPPSLRASFEKKDIDFNIERVRSKAATGRFDDNTSTGRKAKFGDAYLSRLGGGGGYKPKGTDFSATKTTEDWEEVRLKKQLRELEAKIEKVEAAAKKREAKGGRRSDSKPALIKRELEQMLDYKRRFLKQLQEERGSGDAPSKGLKSIEDDIDMVKEQVTGLETHLRKREEILEDLKRQLQAEKGR